MATKFYARNLNVGLNARTNALLNEAVMQTGQTISTYVRRALKEAFERDGVQDARARKHERSEQPAHA
jgi:hypothetical protein